MNVPTHSPCPLKHHRFGKSKIRNINKTNSKSEMSLEVIL